jgi:hypothetical protein
VMLALACATPQCCFPHPTADTGDG